MEAHFRAPPPRNPLSDTTKELAHAQASGCRLLTWDEPEYAARLGQIYDPPALLYVYGNADLLGDHTLAIVGRASSQPLRESNG